MAVQEQDTETVKGEELMIGKRLLDILGLIVAMDGYNGSDIAELIENLKVANIPSVQDQSDVIPEIGQAWRQLK
jgi:hypothetical protein